MKKLIAILLLACMLLTLASCGKKEEADAGVKARTFATETDVATMTVTVQDGNFNMETVRTEPVRIGKAIRQADGTYLLEYLENAGNMTLTPFRDGYYKAAAEYPLGALVKLEGEDSYAAYNYANFVLAYRTEGDRKILRMETQGMVMELWNEGTAFTGYQVACGTYNLRDRGEAKLLDLDVSWGSYDTTTGSGMLTGDKLDITLDGEEVSMSRMAENTYFGMLDGAECILRLKADGVAEMLTAETGADFRFTCVPGEKMEVIVDEYGEMVLVSIQIEGDKLTVDSDQDTDGMLPFTLTEVK